MQYRTSNSLCRKCRKPLDYEEPEQFAPHLVTSHPAPSNADASMQVATQVRELRRARHLSQRQLAGRMQVPRTYISKIENGKAIPTLGSLERLAAPDTVFRRGARRGHRTASHRVNTRQVAGCPILNALSAFRVGQQEFSHLRNRCNAASFGHGRGSLQRISACATVKIVTPRIRPNVKVPAGDSFIRWPASSPHQT
jgi:transcriptional regulator with XRE-family HTH domain